ncbi:hypothetical protein ACSV4D_09615 [Flavobacterium sp. ARAG 55.4]
MKKVVYVLLIVTLMVSSGFEKASDTKAQDKIAHSISEFISNLEQ